MLGGFGERFSRDLALRAAYKTVLVHPMTQNKYLIYIRGDTLGEATEEGLHIAYWLLTRALQEHRSQGRNGEYEAFAVEVLALLQRCRHLYTTTNAELQDAG
jgi:hypothetical protein